MLESHTETRSSGKSTGAEMTEGYHNFPRRLQLPCHTHTRYSMFFFENFLVRVVAALLLGGGGGGGVCGEAF